MTFNVVTLRRADSDARNIVRWIAARSSQGARSWLNAYDALIVRLESEANSFPSAIEDDQFELALRQALFHTRRGKAYRAIFTIVGDEVRILRIRGPGQAPLTSDEII